MDQFTEATLIAKPIIYISLQELYDTHVLLLEHLSSIAPNKRDPLRELLEDLGDSPSICISLKMFHKLKVWKLLLLKILKFPSICNLSSKDALKVTAFHISWKV